MVGNKQLIQVVVISKSPIDYEITEIVYLQNMVLDFVDTRNIYSRVN